LKLENFKLEVKNWEARFQETYIEAEDSYHRTKICVSRQVWLHIL